MKPVRHALASVFTALALGVVVSCATPPAQQNFPELSYRHLPPINLAVGAFDIENRYVPPLKDPNVEHRAPVPPYNAARQWGIDRIKALGGPDRARLQILDASIVEVPLAVTGGVRGMFTRDQAARYDGKIEMTLEILDPNGRRRAFVTGRANRSETVAEGAPIAERERVWLTMTEEMMRQLNQEMTQNVERYFANYMARP
ncbi:MAG: hypothetical protein GEU76_02395 [Alphaproteobacteria bacterium]|nr:hypothetical protein [Alphaproteobacteria bacterium]